MDPSDATPDLTEILQQVRDSKEGAVDQLISAVYSELRGMAARKMAGEQAQHTLQATALVNEAYLKLVSGQGDASQRSDSQSMGWQNRRCFFAAAAEAMRRILIDHARAKKSLKRGGDYQRVAVSEVEVAFEKSPVDIVVLSEALDDLQAQDARAAEVVKLRYFVGLDIAETAELLEVSVRTVKGDWTYAKAWLKNRLAT